MSPVIPSRASVKMSATLPVNVTGGHSWFFVASSSRRA
jgi:hypothetical protein